MRLLEKLLIVGILILFAAFSFWLQMGIEDRPEREEDPRARHDPDYYIENFTTTGMDETGHPRYVLKAERLVHYPDDNTALLDKPCLTQFEPGEAPTRTCAESGWVSPDGEEVLLDGNVRVVQEGSAAGAGGVATTDRMRIRLKDKALK
jgi:lipopolysaccharide export system protein LptC